MERGHPFWWGKPFSRAPNRSDLKKILHPKIIILPQTNPPLSFSFYGNPYHLPQISLPPFHQWGPCKKLHQTAAFDLNHQLGPKRFPPQLGNKIGGKNLHLGLGPTPPWGGGGLGKPIFAKSQRNLTSPPFLQGSAFKYNFTRPCRCKENLGGVLAF